MKMADVQNSYDLEHMKTLGNNLFDKGHNKKVYQHLFQEIKGTETLNAKDGRTIGPMNAPGQKIKIYDFSNGKVPQNFKKQLDLSPYVKSNKR